MTLPDYLSSISLTEMFTVIAQFALIPLFKKVCHD